MGRQKGTLHLGNNIEPNVSAPLDARTVVNTVAELTAAGTFPYSYVGLSVFVRDEKKEYRLIGEDPTKEENWRLEGGSSEATLEDDVSVSNPVGKYSKGDIIDRGTAFGDIFKKIFTKTDYPQLTPPTADILYDMPALAKVGEKIAAGKATMTFNRGAIYPKYSAETEYRAGEVTGYTISLSDADVAFTDANTTGEFDVPEFTRNSKGVVTLTSAASYAAGTQPKDSDGNDYDEALPAGSVVKSKTVEFVLPFVYGAKPSPSINDFSGLSEDVAKKGIKAYNFDTANEHMVFAYDTAYGALTSIADTNGFETISGWSKSILGDYTVYVSKSPTTDSGAKYTFKF